MENIIPPVIVALDGRSHARIDYVRGLLMAEFSPEEMMFKLSGGSFRHWDKMTEQIQEGGFAVIHDTRFDDSPAKIADKISLAYSDPTLRVRPEAITVHPPRDAGSAKEEFLLQQEVEDISFGARIAVFGYANTEKFHHTDGDHIGDNASGVYERARRLGFAGLEIMYPGLDKFFEHVPNPDISIITSKLSTADRTLEETAAEAYQAQGRKKADSIQLGNSVCSEDVLNPEDTVRRVLSVRLASLTSL